MTSLQKKVQNLQIGDSRIQNKRGEPDSNAATDLERRLFNIKDKSKTVVPGVEQNTVNNWLSAASNALQSNATVDVQMKRSIIHTVKGQTFGIKMKNTGTAAIPLPKMPSIESLNKVQLLFNDDTDLCLTLNKESLLYPLRFEDQDKLALYRKGFMCETGEELAVNESRTFYFPLLADVLALNEVFLASIKGEITYRFTFDKAVWGDGGIPEVESVFIMTRHQKYNDEGFNKMQARYNSMKLSFRYRDLQEINRTSTLTPSDSFDYILQKFTSDMSELYIQIYQKGTLVENFQQYIQSYDLLDESGQVSVIGSTPVDVDYHKYILNAAHNVASVVSSNASDSWLVIPLSSKIAEDYKSGSVNGFHTFNGKDTLRLKMKSVLVEGSFGIKIYGAKLRSFTIKKGVISVSD